MSNPALVYRKTVAHVDLAAIRENYRLAAALAPQSKNLAVIKADAYGHGLVPVAKALQDLAPALAVATIDEALELRGAGITAQLLVLEGVNGADALAAAVENDLSLVIHSESQLQQSVKARLPDSMSLWLKIETGMHRLGLEPGRLASALTELGAGRPNIVICTHLACADDLESDKTNAQLAAFAQYVEGFDYPTSICNSAGVLAWPAGHSDWNRPGYLLYGASPMAGETDLPPGFRPAMTFSAELIDISEIAAGESVGYGATWTSSRPTVVGVVAAGYADGYPRQAPSGTPTLVNGRVAPTIGTVSMDMLMIDLTDIESAAVGDIVELWGPGVSVNEVAAQSGTIGYELLTSVTGRVPRLY